jgi:hypothetical protein
MLSISPVRPGTQDDYRGERLIVKRQMKNGGRDAKLFSSV